MSDDILSTLTALLGENTWAATDSDSIDGMPPRWVARPSSTEQTAAVMRLAHEHRLTTVVRGAGTKLPWGTPPERVDLVLDTTGMDQLLEHAPGDLIVRVGAGRRLDDLAQDLAGAGQRLGIDPARRGTVGGAVATAATGPMRLFHGAVRDLVIGITIVRPDGVVARSGGKVVKNVAGYDLGKLLTGSYGTLGVITEVNFRLHPVPAATVWVQAPLRSGSALQDQLTQLVHSQTAPAAAEADLPADGRATIAVQVEGTEAGVCARAETLVRELGGDAQVLHQPPLGWGVEPAGEVLVKTTYAIGRACLMAEAVQSAATAAGVVAATRASVLVGTAYTSLSAGEGPLDSAAVRRFVEELRSRAAQLDGTVVVVEAPREAREGLDVWGPVQALGLMRAVKEQFDPERRLAPGRFVGGI